MEKKFEEFKARIQGSESRSQQRGYVGRAALERTSKTSANCSFIHISKIAVVGLKRKMFRDLELRDARLGFRSALPSGRAFSRSRLLLTLW